MTRRRVLVIDDSKLLHKVYDVSLRCYPRETFDVTYANNGKEGFAQLAEHPDIELIILDINMPVMGGLEFLRECKHARETWGIPVIIASTQGDAEQMNVALRSGAKAYLKKPFTPDQLHKLLDEIFATASRS